MKKINILLAIVIATLFVACFQPSLERKAKSRIKQISVELKDRLKSFDAQNLDVVFSDDSLCVIQCDIKAESYSGEKAEFKMEYYVLLDGKNDNRLLEHYYFLEDKKSIFDRYFDFFQVPLPSDKKETGRLLRLSARTFDAFHLKEVEQDE